MASEVDVANLALDRLGQPAISALNDGSKASNLCGRIYPLSRDQIQRSHPWRWLKARANIAADASAPVWGYTARFRVPADMLALLDVYHADYVMRQGWELEGRYILASVDGPLQIRYIRQSTDPNEWDSLMFSAVAAHMAAEMAEPLTQDPTKRGQAIGWLDAIMTVARHSAGQEGAPVNINKPDDWTIVRIAGGLDPILRPISEP